MFKIEIERSSPEWQVILTGNLNESSVLPAPDFSGQKSVILNLEKMTSMNSAGVQLWVKWIAGADRGTRYKFLKIQPFLIYYIGAVEGMLPPNCELLSFFVPYLDSKTGETELIEYLDGKHFTQSELRLPTTVSSLNPPYVRLEIDVTPARYFSFLTAFHPRITLSLTGD